MTENNSNTQVSIKIESTGSAESSPPPSMIELLQNDMERYLSFEDGIEHKIKQIAASNGFMFNRKDHKIMCIYCNLEWSLEKLLAAFGRLNDEHKRISPRCIIFTKERYNNFKLENFETINTYYTNKNFDIEVHRILSFTEQKWPKTPNLTYKVGALALAKSGFINTEEYDVVKCNYCRLQLTAWEKNDNVEKEHKKYSPQCAFLLGTCEQNVPRGKELSFLFPERNRYFYYISRDIPGGKHPEYDKYEKRLATYSNWPMDINIKQEDLSAAGFYYTGEGDMVRCYHCAIGLESWDASDDVWVEHASFSPLCEYMIENKGQQFIDHCKILFQERLANETTLYDIDELSRIDRMETDDDITELCKICMDKPLEIVLIPCGHFCCCNDCLIELLRTKNRCPVCNVVPLAVRNVTS